MSSSSPESNEPMAVLQHPVLTKEITADDPLETSMQSKQAACDEVSRRLAMVCLAALTLLFSLTTIFFQGSRVEPNESNTTPPQFVTQIPEASNEEWMLLPGVGSKTASVWRKDLMPRKVEPMASAEVSSVSQVDQVSENPVLLESLEDLRGVGPVRAKRLEPYVINVGSPSPQKRKRGKESKSQSFDDSTSILQLNSPAKAPFQESVSNE